MRLLASLLALALFAPGALAGTEDDPEIDDGLDAVSPGANLLSAWFENEPDGVRFTIKVEDVRAPEEDTFYHVLFTGAGVRSIAGIGFDDRGRLLSYMGDLSAGSDGSGLEAITNGKLRDVKWRKGSPAYFSAVIPHGSRPGVQDGSVLIDLHGGVTGYDRGDREWFDQDDRPSRVAFHIDSSQATPLGASRIAWAAGGVLVGGLLAAGLAWRLRPRR